MAFDDYVIQDNTDFAFISGDVLYNVQTRTIGTTSVTGYSPSITTAL